MVVGAFGALFWVMSMASVVALLILIFLPHTKRLNQATAVASITLLLGAIGMLLMITIDMAMTRPILEGISFSLIFLGAVGYVLSLSDMIFPSGNWAKLVRVALPLVGLGVIGLVVATSL